MRIIYNDRMDQSKTIFVKKITNLSFNFLFTFNLYSECTYDQTAYVRRYRTQTVISCFIINRHVSADNHESRQASTLHDSPVTRLFYSRRLVLYLLKRSSLRLFHASTCKTTSYELDGNSFKRQSSDGYRIQTQ